MKLEPIIQMPNAMSATWRQFAVHLVQGAIAIADMTRLEAAASVWHKKNPGRAVEMVIIFPSDARMSGPERERMAIAVKRWESVRAAAATVVLAGGLQGSMHRSVLTGLHMLAPPPHPTKIFGVTAAAVTWLWPYVEKLCGNDVTEESVLVGVEEACGVFQATRRVAS